MSPRVAMAFERFDRAELQFCRTLNLSTGWPMICALFRGVSWLGDGWFWYGLMLLLPMLAGMNGAWVAAQMVLAGAAGVLIYRTIKGHGVRERPFITHSAIHCAAAPLDRYSFPSGHTLHAVSYTILVSSHFPVLTGPVTAFAVLVALSRVVLGLHYPTDVAVGALLGAGLATVSLRAAPLLGV